MESSSLQLCDLPDEILLLIFKKIDNVALLYSLFNINQRLNPILYDSNLTNCLNLVEFCQGDYTYRLSDPILCDSNFANCLEVCSGDYAYRLSDPILDRFCSQILPSIRHHIKRLNLEPSSIECILRTANYPNLCTLGLYNLKIDKGKHLFTDETPLTDRLRNQILSLVIDISKKDEKGSTEDLVHFIFLRIFSMFTNLNYLHIASLSSVCQVLSFGAAPPSIFSSNLFELHINLKEFSDCLYLLDGRLSHLRTLHATIRKIYPESSLLIENRKQIPNLRCFELCCCYVSHGYDETIVPLLHRMPNLEELSLNLGVMKDEAFIDGNSLKSLINDMTRLRKFIFNIRSIIDFDDIMNFVANEDIENSFSNFHFNQVICCVDYFSKLDHGQCHIYSCPYVWKEYLSITNHFPGGLFPCVQKISLFDDRPFEYEFFLCISQSFPLIKVLTLVNRQPQQQKKKQSGKCKDDNRHSPRIEYPHLRELYLEHVHEDYIEQFLDATKTCLPNSVNMSADYNLMIRVTDNFRRTATRVNCSKINYHIYGNRTGPFPEHFKDYFLRTVV